MLFGKDNYEASNKIHVRDFSRTDSRPLGSARPCARWSQGQSNVPFTFVVGNKELKAGDYVIESLLANNALQFRSEDGDVQQIAFTVPIETNRTGNHER